MRSTIRLQYPPVPAEASLRALQQKGKYKRQSVTYTRLRESKLERYAQQAFNAEAAPTSAQFQVSLSDSSSFQEQRYRIPLLSACYFQY